VRATALKAVYVPLQVVEAVEYFKDGVAVPAFGWPGSIPRAYGHYNGLVVLLPQPLTDHEAFLLYNNTGFSQNMPLTPAELLVRTRWRLESDRSIYFLSTQTTPVSKESLEAVDYKLRGKGAVLIPWVTPLQGQLLNDSGEELASLSLSILPASRHEADVLRFMPQPDWRENALRPEIMLPSHLAARLQGAHTAFSLKISNEKTSLVFPVSLVSSHNLPVDVAFVPPRLGGVLNLFRSRNMTFDAGTGEFILSRQGYAGFRLYAKTIDDVESVRHYFESQGIPVHTEAQRIKEVTDLDYYLTLLFRGIATSHLSGAATWHRWLCCGAVIFHRYGARHQHLVSLPPRST
jgi:putative ABC transport system permease protein